MTRSLLVLAALVASAGCAGTTLPYTPVQQPPGARVSAAYQIVGDRLRVEVDTSRRRLEEAVIVKADGSELRAESIDVLRISGGPPPSIGIGVGGGSFGGGIGIGSGVSVGIPIGGPPPPVDGNSFAVFPLNAAGPAPWSVRLRLYGTEPVVILVGGPAGPR